MGSGDPPPRSPKGRAAPPGVGRDTLDLERKRAEEIRRKLRTPPSPRPAPQAMGAGFRWHLESPAQNGRLERVSLHPFPFRIGRIQGLELTLLGSSVSKTHAEIYLQDGHLRIRDLGSSNGTFVNGELVEDVAIGEGDVLHIAEFEFRVGAPEVEQPDTSEEPPTTVSIGGRRPSSRFVQGTRELKDLLRDSAVTVVFQPIVRLPGGAVVASEALGRGLHPRLPPSPLELFHIAESMGAEGELSRLFRRKAVELARHRPDFPTLFLNTHPSELSQPGLVESLEELRALAPQLDLALEIHESVITKPSVLADLRKLLSESNIGIAYDDFGAGQARLLELAEAPPHYLKFDRRFVAGIDAPDQATRRQLLTSLVILAGDLRVKTIAEGVETPGEAAVCANIGFSHGQGYHFGRPAPLEPL